MKSSSHTLSGMSRELAEKTVMETVNLLTKSMNLLDVEPDNPSAIYNIRYGFLNDLEDCKIILRSNVNLSGSYLKQLEKVFQDCNTRRMEYVQKYAKGK